VEKSVSEILAVLQRMSESQPSDKSFAPETITECADKVARAYDSDNGGLGRAPKFPNAGVYELFLRSYNHSKGERYLEMVTHTLTKMARGGIYDHLGGGFHRYSVDEKWLVPHFEKMLYDNAQLIRIYAHAYTVTREPLFKTVVEETVGYLLREMRDLEGGFYSTQDADSEGEEGKFFVWTPLEVIRLLGEEEGEIFNRIYDVSETGNFEGKNIPHPVLTIEQASKFFRKERVEIESLIAVARKKLFAERETRAKPFRDEKIITAWNGLMLSGLAGAIRILGSSAPIEAARRNVDFLFGKMSRDDFLLHTYKDGQAKLLGYLDDYAFVIVGLLDLYETLFDRSYLDRAVHLSEIMLREFSDESEGGFFYTGKSHEPLISRTKPAFDASIPSGNAMAAQALLRLYYFTTNDAYRNRAERVLRCYYDPMTNQPFGFAHLICALDMHIHAPKEIVVVGDQEDPQTKLLVAEIQSLYLPNSNLQLVSPKMSLETISPLLQGKLQLDERATVYVCENFTCSAPVTSPEVLRSLLAS
jgi:uncharacterized protein YyaL (SSP411 family)